MLRKIVAVWVSLVMLFGFITIMDTTMDFIPTVKGVTLYVNETGSSGAYTNIQDAINASDDGDTVFVYNGTYNEEIYINKTISLIGENKSNTTIIYPSTQSATVIIENAEYVNLTGFTIISEVVPIGSKDALLLRSSSNCSVSNNIIHGYDYGGINFDHSSYNKLVGNVINGSQWGTNVVVWFYSSHNKIKDNIILEGMNTSISIGGYIYEEGCDANEVINNNITMGYFAIKVSSDNNVIKENDVRNNNYGIDVDGDNNLIYNNNIINNTNQAEDTGINNLWNYSYPTGGNYWSDYAGLDEFSGINQDQPGGDGIGDTPYDIDVGSQDNYPLMVPLPNTFDPVYNIDSNEYFTSIQSAIDDSDTLDYHIIVVSPGTYNENVVVNKTLAIIGAVKTMTIIDGNSNGPVVSIVADYVFMQGFTIRNASIGWWDCGVYINANNVTVRDNIIKENSFGIVFEYSNDIEITENLILNNNVDGIKGNTSFYKSTISNNTVYNNRNGVALDDESAIITRDHRIFGNTIFDNSQVGIFCFKNEGTEIYMNSLTGPLSHGIYIQQGQSNLVYENTVEDAEKGIWLFSTSSNKIFHNSIINNTDQASDNGNNQWDDGYPSGGNYWSDYSGLDNFNGPNQDIVGSDEIGDTEHPISGGSNNDNYPFMSQGGAIPPPTIDEVRITYTPDGVEVDDVYLDVGADITLYASSYNDSNGYVGLIDLDWSQTPHTIGIFSIIHGSSTTFTAGLVGDSALISGSNATLNVNDNFLLSVNAPTVDYIQIRNETNNQGINVISDEFTLGGDVTQNYYCAGYNNTADYVGDVTAYWSLNRLIGEINPSQGQLTLFTATTEGTGILGANLSGKIDTVTIKVNPEIDTTAPAAPTGIVVLLGTGVDSLVITWNPNTESDLAGYNIFRATSTFGTFTQLNGLLTDTSYTDSGLSEGTYYYRLTAQDLVPNISENSTPVSGTISAPPEDPDEDDDGLPDDWEKDNFGDLDQEPYDDFDGDGFSNFEEYLAGSDPTNPKITPIDMDGDGLPDDWEQEHFDDLNQEPNDDYDEDGFSNLEEYLAGSDPTNSLVTPEDMDGDGLPDIWELFYFGNLSQILNDDYDIDGYTNEEELSAETDPTDYLDYPGVNEPPINILPVANLTAAPTTIKVGETVSFNGSGSYDPDGFITSHRWDYGDGSQGATGVEVTSHTYNIAGTYIASLTVEDNMGSFDSITITIKVEEPDVTSPGKGEESLESSFSWIFVIIVLVVIILTEMILLLKKKEPVIAKREEDEGNIADSVEDDSAESEISGEENKIDLNDEDPNTDVIENESTNSEESSKEDI